ncbi:MAG: DUF3365 domain-containing protein [Candidatus Thiodiazotropha sp. (ex Lucinoma borealis)]|nr:DUF3365 domain-containing protein [Candidatus Thiodiazotropha sp. (ex Lucinoma borealis)]
MFWLVLTGLSLVWNTSRMEQSIQDIAMERGQLMFEMVRQTKINPDLMTSAPNLFKKQTIDNIGFRVISLTPMNPANGADQWEAEALKNFQSKGDYAFDSLEVMGELLFRYIGPVFAQEVCLKCHGGENVKVGDLRGGISVIVKGQPIYDSHQVSTQMMVLMHFAGFLLLSFTSVFFMHQLRDSWLVVTKTRDQLKYKERFLTNVTNAMGEGFLVLNKDGVISFANPESERLLGWKVFEMEGSKFIDLVCHEQEGASLKICERAIYQTLQDGKTRREDDHVFKHKDGRLIPVSYTVSVMYEGELLAGVVLTFNDISERKQSAEERSRLERQLNQTHKMEAVGQLAGGIAHEINTPIQYVGDNLRFLKEAFDDMGILLQVYEKLLAEAEENETLLPQVEAVRRAIKDADLAYLNEEAPKTIDQSIAGADQVARIVLAMKEFAHPGTKKRALADLNQIISNASAVCKNEWKYVADTELRLAEDLPQVNCTGGELSQVILNLIVNAAHAIEEAKHGEKGKITISSEVVGNQVEVRVTDTGAGIPKDVQEYVFNPFFTTKDVGSGTGQGLAIAQDIVVSKHHGELFFETEEGVGTTFTIRIPLEVKDA